MPQQILTTTGSDGGGAEAMRGDHTAGLPATPDLQQQFQLAGVEEFIHLRANCAQMLARLQQKIGL